MEKFILFFVCLFSGVILRQLKVLDKYAPIVINNLLIYFFIPVLTLYHIPKIQFDIQLIWLSITPFMVYLFSFLFIKLIGFLMPIDRSTQGALIMCSGIGSTSFVGFPVFELLYGEVGLSYGIVLSLAGTLFVFNTVGIFTGFAYSQSEKVSWVFLLKKVFRFPPFIAFLIGIGMNSFNLHFPLAFDAVLQRLTAPFAVLALLVIGLQMQFSLDRAFLKNLLIGQSYKLVLAPLLIYVFMWQILGITDVVAKVCILGAGIGSMNAISIVAAQLNLNPKLATAMPAISIPVSIFLLFLIDTLLS